MSRNYRFSILSALVPALLLCLQHAACAFEIFPRPEAQYTVQRGDTLFGISGFYYANPALWPFLWNQNPSISIKNTAGAPEKQPLTPGTRIDLHHHRTDTRMVNDAYAPPTGIPDDVRFLVNRIPRKGIPYEKQYFRYKLSMRPTQLWGYVVGSPDPFKDQFLERDILYIRFRPSKKQVVMVGDRFGVYREKGPLNHPLNPDRKIGYMSEIVGEIEITSTGHDLVTGIVLESFVELAKGDKISLYAPREREIVPTKVHRMLTGTILISATRFVDSSSVDSLNLEKDIMFIDRGECDGMKEGTLVNIYRASHPIADPYFRSRWLNTPDRYVGEAMILKAFEKNSTILITRSREEVIPGDIIKSVSD